MLGNIMNKQQILAFEAVEGQRMLDIRRMFNAHKVGVSMDNIHGGKKLGEGLEKCVYDSNEDMMCKSEHGPKFPPTLLPALPPNQVNVVLGEEAYMDEKLAKQKIASNLDPGVMDRIFITLQDHPVCTDLVMVPSKCTSDVHKASKAVLVRSERGSTRKKFESKEAFGYAVLNLVFGLWAMHSHGFIHGDVKIEPGADNAVLVEDTAAISTGDAGAGAGAANARAKSPYMVYKLIDLGMVTPFSRIRKGIEDRHSVEARELWNMRKYVYWSVGHLYAMFNLEDVQQKCKLHGVSWRRVLQLYFENIDMVGFMRSLTILVYLNPELRLKPLLQQLQASPQDFRDDVAELNARKVVWATARAISTSIDVGDRGDTRGNSAVVSEMFLDLPTIYQKIRGYCNLAKLVPETIQEYARHQSPSPKRR